MPILLHIPHAATAIPLRTGYLVDEAALQHEQLLLTDWHTDHLFGNTTDTAITAPFSRIFCDVERFPDDAHEVMAAAGMGVALVRLKLGAPWIENGTLVRLFDLDAPSPHAHYLCWRTGAMDRWECAAFADWLHKSMV